MKNEKVLVEFSAAEFKRMKDDPKLLTNALRLYDYVTKQIEDGWKLQLQKIEIREVELCVNEKVH